MSSFATIKALSFSISTALLCSALLCSLKASERKEHRCVCFCLFITKSQRHQARKKKRKRKARCYNSNSTLPQGIFWRGENNWGQGPSDKCTGQRCSLDFPTGRDDTRVRGWRKKIRDKTEKGRKRAYLLGIDSVTLLAHTHKTNLLCDSHCGMTDSDWRGEVCVCMCMCADGGKVCHGRQVRSGIPQRNHLLGLSMSQQPITVTVSVCGCWRGGLAIKWRGLLLIIALWPCTKAKRLLGQFEFE